MTKNGRLTEAGRAMFHAHAEGLDIMLDNGGNVGGAIYKLRSLYNRHFPDRSQTSFLDFFATLCLAYKRWNGETSTEAKAA